ncbi:MAG: antitoxin of toxin-antitoxin stability system [Gammaproteobacteria bacterium]|nr:antitoxin of toxin-antitoxin stability system [Gammaproteobacteria bacterium]
MRVAVKETTVYGFDELPDETKEKVLRNLRGINVGDSFWHECIFDDIKEIGKLIGIDIDNIYFSGFWGQGDGACFEGSYSYRNGSVKAVKEYAPMDKELHKIALSLSKAQRKGFYQSTAVIKHRGHYYHKMGTEIWVDNYYDYDYDAICGGLRSFMDWIYRRLEKEYEYLTSDDSIKNTIEANEYEFDSNGKIYS